MFHKQHPAVGARPGTLVIDPRSPAPRVRALTYSAEGVVEHPVADLGELRALRAAGPKLWVDVQGLGDEGVLRQLGEIFAIHPLAIEDVVNIPQRPKIEQYDEHQLFIVRHLVLGEGLTVTIEQISLFLGRDYVLTFQERYGGLFEPVARRLSEGKGPMRRSGSDYLAYALLDTVIDSYYPLLEELGGVLEELEGDVLADARGTLGRLTAVKKALLQVRRAVWPQRDAVAAVLRQESPFVSEDVLVYFRDTHDHCVQATDITEVYRELASGLLNTHLSVISNRANEIMRVLTIMASIFIPLTFMAGIYGMNFENMPELQVWWSYPALLALMVMTALSMLLFFHRRGWVGRRGDGE